MRTSVDERTGGPPPRSIPQELRALGSLALPLAVAQGGQALMGVVDAAVVGRVGAATLAGVGLGNGLFFAVGILGMGVVFGVDPLISQAFGAGERLAARRWLWQAVWASVLTAAVLALPLLLVPFALGHTRIPAEVVREAGRFVHWRLPGLAPFLLFFAARAYLQSAGRARDLVVATVLANVLNLGLDVLFVFGGAPLPSWTGPLHAMPALGGAGAALATDLCTCFELLFLAWCIGRVLLPDGARVRRGPAPGELREIFRVGLPVGLHLFLESGIFTVASVLAARLGREAGAAHQIALSLASVTFTLSVGIGAAGSVRVGHAIGAGNPGAARRAGLTAFAAGAAFMSCSALVFALCPGLLARAMSTDPAVLRLATPLMVLAAAFQISDGAQAIGAGVLRGAGDSRFTFIANLVGHYGVGLPVTLGVGLVLGRGVVGIWCGLCAGLTAVAAALFSRFWLLSARPIRPLMSAPARVP